MILEIKLPMDHQTRYLLKCQEVKDMTYKYEQSQIQLAKLTETYNQLKQNYSLVVQQYTQLQRQNTSFYEQSLVSNHDTIYL